MALLGCWAHVRRKYEHALEEDPDRASEALRMIGELYAIERYAKENNLPPYKIKRLRETEAYPRIQEFERWIEEIVTSGRILKQPAMGKAISYAYSLYPRLSRYVMDGRYQIEIIWQRMLCDHWRSAGRTISFTVRTRRRITPLSYIRC